MRIEFTRMQGAGNRILVVDVRASGDLPPSRDQLAGLAARSSGPSFDQLMWVSESDASGIAAYRVFNSDGSEAGQCGNGVRCVARLLADSRGETAFILDGPTGPVECRVRPDGMISVNMGTPDFEPANIPFVSDHESKSYKIVANGSEYIVGAVSMGNPHCVLAVADVADADVAGIGPVLETHARFPERANVGFMSVRDPATIDLRVWERGVGETLACGTGACAAFAVARRRREVGEEVTVCLPGGQLVVSCAQRGGDIWLTGNAEKLSEGTIDL